MLKFIDYDIVFQEIPDEVTLAVNLSNCPFRCKGCHSPHLQRDIGEELNERALSCLLEKYGNSITCLCFMGGDGNRDELFKAAELVKKYGKKNIKTAWYSGNDKLFNEALQYFDFVKIGPYIAELGGIDKNSTNQRLYKIDNGNIIDYTWRMNMS